jgi:hypothetical protein
MSCCLLIVHILLLRSQRNLRMDASIMGSCNKLCCRVLEVISTGYLLMMMMLTALFVDRSIAQCSQKMGSQKIGSCVPDGHKQAKSIWARATRLFNFEIPTTARVAELGIV